MILLTALNARYIHAAFGLRYLMANLCDLAPQAKIIEFDINRRPLEIAEALLAENPRIIALGVYIWNITLATELVSLLKRIRPEVIIVLGGPEVSHETVGQPIVALADCTITGEADLAFASTCRDLLAGRDVPSIVSAPLPHFQQLQLPYHLYTDDDLAHRVTYVEASRGCPFTCEFCLSSLEIPVRSVPVQQFLTEMDGLLQRGARHLKFVDRTFNLHTATGRAILEFCLSRWEPGRFFHFEMIPDRLPEPLREIIAQFPPGSLQFEVGIQTFNPDVAGNISRRNHYGRVEENLTWLRDHTGVHIHADLIAGLPGETLASFGTGFDRLSAMRPQEIQVGILKRLRGTPIIRHDAEFSMVYSEHPPYEILRTRDMSFADLQFVRRFAKWHDVIANSGNFTDTAAAIRKEADSPFHAWTELTHYLHARSPRGDGVALIKLVEHLFMWLTEARAWAPSDAAIIIWQDFTRPGRGDRPPRLLRPHLPESLISTPSPSPANSTLRRQALHHTQS